MVSLICSFVYIFIDTKSPILICVHSFIFSSCFLIYSFFNSFTRASYPCPYHQHHHHHHHQHHHNHNHDLVILLTLLALSLPFLPPPLALLAFFFISLFLLLLLLLLFSSSAMYTPALSQFHTHMSIYLINYQLSSQPAFSIFFLFFFSFFSMHMLIFF